MGCDRMRAVERRQEGVSAEGGPQSKALTRHLACAFPQPGNRTRWNGSKKNPSTRNRGQGDVSSRSTEEQQGGQGGYGWVGAPSYGVVFVD